MSSYDPNFNFDESLGRLKTEMKSYPNVTDDEALVMAMCVIIPRNFTNVLQDEYDIGEKTAWELLRSGADKYIAGGGKDHWQG